MKNTRNSNLELYRIIVMLLIVAHHYVVNSGVIQEVYADSLNVRSSFMLLIGMWGKIGINCFVMITGWFMCTSKITMRKFLRLILQVELYKFLFTGIFLITGYEQISLRVIRNLLPVTNVADGFTSCFILFFLLIPFLNKLLHNLSKAQHGWLVVLLLFVYSVLPSFHIANVKFNYVTWFSVLYILMAYLRFYGVPVSFLERRWGGAWFWA